MEIVIKPYKFLRFNFKEFIEYRDTLFFLVWKDIKIKYKQTLLGFLWVIIQPLLMVLVFVLLQRAIVIPISDSNIPYALFVLSGILYWNLFSSSVTNSSNSIVNNANMLKKIYFPRIFFPLSSLLVSLFDFFIAIVIYIPLMFYYKIYPTENIFWIFPLTLILVIMISLGIGSFFSALNVIYRDVKYVIPYFVQLLFFISPIFYNSKFIANKFINNIYYLNPFVGILELLRYGLFSMEPYKVGVLISIVSNVIVFILGLYYFRKIENIFADLV